MSRYFDPFDADRPLRLQCACGQDHSPEEHNAAVAREQATQELQRRSETEDFQTYAREFIQASMMKALFPQDDQRRRFLRAVGKGTAMAAISSVMPLTTLEAMAQEAAPLEKKDLKIGFIPITCATPLIMAHPLGFYKKQGLNVSVVKTAGWALIRDKMINKEYDATHFLSPMPLAISMGLGSNPKPMHVATIQNTNGQAITLANKHKDKRDPKMWKGFKFAVPFEYSMHNFLLRHYLASHRLDPDRDVQLRVMAPPDMVEPVDQGDQGAGLAAWEEARALCDDAFHPLIDALIAAEAPGPDHFGDDLVAGGRVVGAVVDSVSDVMQLSEQMIQPAPEMSDALVDTTYITGIANINERLLILMDIESLMSSADMGLIDSAIA